MKRYIHAVPNFSEGRREKVINEIVGTLQGKEDIELIDYYPDYDFNRTVIEVIGSPEPLCQALLQMAGKSYELINMEAHTGAHPRIGAQDTIPLFPLLNVSLDECRTMAEELGKELYERFGVPVYFSGENARNEDRKSLSFIRRGQYEGLKKAAHTPDRAPDLGPSSLHPTAGATIVSSAVSGLVAVNIILDSQDVTVAKTIAKMVRGPSGGFSTIRAVGFFMEDKKKAAVSMNMFDTQATPIHRVYKVVQSEAERYGITLLGTQIVGTLHQEALIDSASHFLRLVDFDKKQIIENHMIGK